MLTAEQIKDRLETAFLPHKAIHDYAEKITFKVWSAKDASHLFTHRDLPVHELGSEGYLKDVIDGTSREIKDKLKHQSASQA